MILNQKHKLAGASALVSCCFAIAGWSVAQTCRVYNPPFRNGNLSVGDVAPDFTLQDKQGKQRVTLSHLRGRPVVLIFGSMTCDYFTRGTQVIQGFYKDYKDKAHIYAVYTREAHPGGYMHSRSGNPTHTALPKAINLKQRRTAACLLTNRFKLSVPVLVDTMDNKVDTAYRGSPVYVYVINADGEIVSMSSDPNCLSTSAVQQLIS